MGASGASVPKPTRWEVIELYARIRPGASKTKVRGSGLLHLRIAGLRFEVCGEEKLRHDLHDRIALSTLCRRAAGD